MKKRVLYVVVLFVTIGIVHLSSHAVSVKYQDQEFEIGVNKDTISIAENILNELKKYIMHEIVSEAKAKSLSDKALDAFLDSEDVGKKLDIVASIFYAQKSMRSDVYGIMYKLLGREALKQMDKKEIKDELLRLQSDPKADNTQAAGSPSSSHAVSVKCQGKEFEIGVNKDTISIAENILNELKKYIKHEIVSEAKSKSLSDKALDTFLDSEDVGKKLDIGANITNTIAAMKSRVYGIKLLFNREALKQTYKKEIKDDVSQVRSNNK